jgi:hypothetical protein
MDVALGAMIWVDHVELGIEFEGGGGGEVPDSASVVMVGRDVHVTCNAAVRSHCCVQAH